MTGYVASMKVPAPALAVYGSGILLVLGGLGVLLGQYVQISLVLIVIFLVPVTLIMHPFWTRTDPQAKMGGQGQLSQERRPPWRRVASFLIDSFLFKENMSKSAKIATLVVVIVVIAGIWWYVASDQSPEVPAYTQTVSTTTPENAPSSASDTSDAAITKDMANIDTQMNGLNSDSASADQSLSSSQSTQ